MDTSDGVDLASAVAFHPGPAPDWPADERSLKLHLDDAEIGSVSYHVCSTCRDAFLLEIGIIDSCQRHGIGTRVITWLRAEFPGYRWSTTPQKKDSRTWWHRLQRAYPGEYEPPRDSRTPCPHICAVIDPP